MASPVERIAPASANQKRMFVLNRLSPAGTEYNVPVAFRFRGALDLPRLRRALDALAARHPALRTIVDIAGEEVLQTFTKPAHVRLPIRRAASEAEIARIRKHFVRPFDLERGPLVRASLIELAKEDHILLLDLHHSVCDGVSVDILFDDLGRLYDGEALDPLPLDTTDFARWQQTFATSPEGRAQEAYWLDLLRDDRPVSALPIDFARQTPKSFAGDRIFLHPDAALVAALRAVAAANRVSMYMLLLAAYFVWLSKYCGEEDVVAGTLVAGRHGEEFRGIVGLFVNTLVLRSRPRGSLAFADYLAGVRNECLDAFENADYQFEDLVDRLAPPRDLGRNPLFDTMFTALSADAPPRSCGGVEFSRYELDYDFSKFDLSVTSIERRDGGLDVELEYCSDLFRRESIERMGAHYLAVLRAVAADPRVRIAEIELCAPIVAPPRAAFGASVIDQFEERARETPSAIAIASGAESVDYLELDRRAAAIAARLHAAGVKAGELAGLAAAPSIEMVAALLGVLKLGAAYVPIDPATPLDRFRTIAADCGFAVLLVSDDARHLTAPGVATIGVNEEGEGSWARPAIAPGDLAYVIYTSGSTGAPKGVMVSHGALANYVAWAAKRYAGDAPIAFALHSPLSVDLTVTSIFVPLVSGNRIVVYGGSAADVMRDVVQRGDVDVVKVTPTHLRLLAEVLERCEATALRRIIVGGEDLPAALAARIHARLGGRVDIINEYGPTEATVGCTAHTFDPEVDMDGSVPIGTAIDNAAVYVLDRQGKTVPPGVKGELCIAGACLAEGYAGNAALTAERFPTIGGVRVYRTGDVGRCRADGLLEFLGRNDDQVKIRGFRIELGEIEANLRRLPNVRDAIVIKRADAAGDPALCAYIVAGAPFSADDLRARLARALPPQMIPSWFVPLEQLPPKRGGKLDRNALPAPPELASARPYAPPRNDVEAALVRVWQEVLGVDAVGIDDDFFALGGHSLKAMLMAVRVEREAGARLSLHDVFANAVVRDLAPLVARGRGESRPPIVPAGEREHYPVSSAQKRLFILHQIAPSDVQYNVPWAIAIDGDFDAGRWERALRAVVARHESLRTSFAVAGDEIVQRVHADANFTLERRAASGTLQQEIDAFVRPFDLGSAPLMRAAAVESDGRGTLLVDMHHIVCDGLSASILLDDLLASYEGRALDRPPIQYKDYATWQRHPANRDAVAEQARYWTARFQGDLPVLNLPTDFPRGAQQSFAGDAVRFRAGRDTLQRLNALQRQCGATLHMVLLAVYTILLSKLSGQDDVVVGTPVAGRNHASLERVAGMFVNTLAMRNRAAGELSFREFLRDVRRNALEAYANQDYPFEELVDTLAIERDLSRNPLFDTMFATLDRAGRTFSAGGISAEMVDFEWKVSKFDLTLLAAETADGIDLEIEYCTRLFRRDTVERFAAQFLHLLDQVVGDPDRAIAGLEVLTDAERRQILGDFNATARPYPDDRAIHAIFEARVAAAPDATAVVCGERSLSYRELNAMANRIARTLLKRGLSREEVAGIIAAPSIEMIAGILAILKAGGAYLPIDRDCPAERARVMLDDCGARFVLVAGAEWRDDARQVLDLADPATLDDDDSDLGLAVGPRDLAYVIYTSGTTGTPKGVMIEHRSVNNLCAWHNAEFGVTAADRATKYARFSFDASVWEIFPYLQAGASLHVVDDAIRLDLPRLNRFFEEHGITIAFLPTPVCELFLELDNRSLRVLLTGGDRLRRVRPTRYRLVNNYGPTENTVVTTSGTVEPGREPIPIGRPIANSRVYLLDAAGHPVPVGVPGELYVSGAGLARAYLGDAARTAEKFVANPFEPGERMYRSGDLARWLPDGAIEYIGRTDAQVKIRGCRTEPREIEAAILDHDAVHDAVVVAREDREHNKFLCAYVVWNDGARPAELRADLARRLPDYMVPAFFMTLDRIPMNATGKLDASRLPAPDLEVGSDAFVAARTEAERRLAEIWCRVLERERVGVHENFFQIGGDSLRATVMLARANRELMASLPLGVVFDHPTIAGLAACFESVPHENVALAPVPDRRHYATTPIQALLYALCSSLGGVEYNLPMAYELTGELDVPRLEAAFRELIRRHESLRTSFHVVAGKVVQSVSPSVDFSIDRLEECGDGEIDKTMRDFIRPFDLSRPPLVRVAIVPMGPHRHVLLIDVHHLVCDGTSMGILFRDVAAIYGGKTLAPPSSTFKDFSEWLGGYLKSDKVRAQETYWRGVLDDPPPLLRLDIDYDRPPKFSFQGSRIEFDASPAVHAGLRELCTREGVTLYMLLLAAYAVLLSKYSRQEEMIVAAPTSGRYLAEVHDVVGMFVSTHMVRTRPRAELRFTDFLRDVKSAVRGALDHQQYQLWDLIVGYAMKNAGKSPFSTVFIVQDQAFTAMDMPGLGVKERDPGYDVSKFDLTLGAVERDGTLHFELEYSTDVYRRSTARRMSGHLLHVLEQIVADPAQSIRGIALLNDAEREAMLRAGAGPRLAPVTETLLDLFERRAAEGPERIAIAGERPMSYDDLNRRANRLARHLSGQQIAAGDRVALMMDASPDLVVAMLALWKLGAAYVPLSPAWPAKRVASAMERSGAKLRLRNAKADVADDANLDLSIDPGAVAYTTLVADRIVPIDHRALASRCRWYSDRFEVTSEDCSAKFGHVATSATPFEIFPFLAAGASVCFVPESEDDLDTRFRANRVTVAWLPARECETLASAPHTTLRLLLTSARNVRPSRSHAYELVRCFGPAENVEITTCCAIRGDGRGRNLGTPVAGTDVTILGHDDGLQPAGVTGEMCIGGGCLAKGEWPPNPHVPGSTMFRSGIAARWLTDGTLELSGRPAEVFIGAHRVVLAEIEARLRQHPAIADAVVVFDDDDPLAQRLIAFLVLRAPLLEIQSSLGEWLPEWMIPATFLQLPEIPRDSDGVVAFDRLPLPPRPPGPDDLAALIEEVVGAPPLSPDGDLRDIGMSSLHAMQLSVRMRERYGVAPRPCHILAEPTVAGISRRLEKANA